MGWTGAPGASRRKVLVTPRTMVPLGFLCISAVMLAIALWLIYHAMVETRIGTALVETGRETQALVVSAERIERAQCSRSQRAICVDADNYIATIVYQVSGLRAGREINLTPQEFAAYEAGEEVTLDLIYLPTAPLEVERTSGARLAAANNTFLQIYVVAAFAITFLAIGGIAALITRKRAPSV